MGKPRLVRCRTWVGDNPARTDSSQRCPCEPAPSDQRLLARWVANPEFTGNRYEPLRAVLEALSPLGSVRFQDAATVRAQVGDLIRVEGFHRNVR